MRLLCLGTGAPVPSDYGTDREVPSTPGKRTPSKVEENASENWQFKGQDESRDTRIAWNIRPAKWYQSRCWFDHDLFTLWKASTSRAVVWTSTIRCRLVQVTHMFGLLHCCCLAQKRIQRINSLHSLSSSSSSPWSLSLSWPSALTSLTGRQTSSSSLPNLIKKPWVSLSVTLLKIGCRKGGKKPYGLTKTLMGRYLIRIRTFTHSSIIWSRIV